MSLPENWATPEDFATLFQYLWHQGFPIDQLSTGARRTDWTIHIGIIIRNIGDLMGLVTRFERGGRTDAVLRSANGDEIACEWEWGDIRQSNELPKLKNFKLWRKDKKTTLRYAVLISYTAPVELHAVLDRVQERWNGANWPLLLIIVTAEQSRKYSTGKDFKELGMWLFDTSGRQQLRTMSAIPWHIEDSRWHLLATEQE